ncbi:GH25 family lysozyme [Butyrivibrio sp. INlla14]|uniref:GH25 family lysozyme n=1 Tax=Butyrivibrio sp. INlla14 TaxID=1520808 RepID=UPI00087676AD|nr:GH25 family lysozyme [Butyrivibrio sp. INlla14]SCY33491.1 Ig-like domain (group 2) [Butyrivibrio sp. INlla14]
MKKLFGNKPRGKREREHYRDEVIDFDEDFDEEYDDADYYEDDDDRYEDDDYSEDEIDDRYEEDDYPEEDEVDDRYEDDEYPDDYPEEDEVDNRYEDDYPEEDEVVDNRYEDDDDYPEEDEVDDRYEDDEYPDDYPDDYPEDDEIDDRYEEDDYPEEDEIDDRYEDDDYPEEDYYPENDDVDEDIYYPGDNRRSGGRDDRGSRRSRRDRRRDRDDRDDRDSFPARIIAFLSKTTAVERIAAIFAILLVAGGILTATFYVSAKNNRSQLASFADVGSTMTIGDDMVVGESGLIAVADAERARAMAAELVSEDNMAEEEEVEVADDAENVTIKMTVTSIKSDIKVKFINSETNKLVANLPLEIEVVGPDGTKVTYNDHDQDGIIYKKDITKGEYKVTPKALPEGYENYKLEIKTKTVTVKDTVEMKAVDVSNEVKKESQVNAAKEDTAVKTEVESKLEDTVEWVESTQTAVGESSDGNFTYEEVKKDDIPNPSSTSMVGTRKWMFLGFARGKASTGSSSTVENPGEGNGESSGESSTQPQKDKITISDLDKTMKVGETQTISSTGTSKTVEYSSDNIEVVSVSGTTLTAKKAGTATITASAENCEPASVTITVEDVPEQKKDFSINGSTIDVKVGETKSIGASADGKSVSYAIASGNDKVELSSDGSVKGLAEGEAKITIKAEGYNDGSVTIKVTPADKKNIQGAPATLAMKAGDTTQIKVTDPAQSAASFESDKTSVATVDKDGNVKAVAEGTANITIKATGYNDFKVVVTVSKADAKEMKAESTSLTVKVSDTVQIKVTEPANAKLTYKSADEKIATVTADGKVTGVSANKTTITVTDTTANSAYKPLTINVEVTAKEGNKVPMSITKITLCEGQSIKLSSTDKNASIALESSNTNVATISDKATVNGKSAGDATITVKATGYADNTIALKVVGKGTTLKDKNGNVLYVLKSDGTYREATYEDYYSGAKLYKRKAATAYRYTGWQTIGGKTYFYDKNGNYVTGEQVIQGAKYTFGSDGALQAGQGTMGIDVSKWNGNIDWKAVKNSGVSFVIIRCGYRGSSQGALIEDPKFRANIQGAQNAGIRVGVYFFTQAVNEVEAVEEASMVINLIKGYNISYPVYLDVEASHGRGDNISAAQRTANIKAFCGTIQNAGYKAGVYANKTWFTSYINTSQITNYRIWLAQYAKAVTYNGSRYDMWQYSSKGRVTGISGNVDMNICY